MRSRTPFLPIAVVLLLAYWVTRLVALDSFPPFIDESFHVSVAEHIARTRGLFAYAGEGRIFTYWWLIPFQPFETRAAFWVARAATLLAALVGLAALLAMGRLAAGRWGGALAGLLYVFSAYHLFFDRLALSDTIATAAVALGLYFAARLARRADDRDAALAGFALFLAAGAKIGALPYLGIPLAAALTLGPRRYGWRRRARWLAVALAAALGPLAVLGIIARWRGQNIFFHIQESRPSGSALLDLDRIAHNVERLWDLAGAYWTVPVLILLLAGVLLLVLRRAYFLPLVFAAPAVVLVLSLRQSSRYALTTLTLLLLAGAVALGVLVRGPRTWPKLLALGAVVVWAAWQWAPFFSAIVNDPLDLPLAPADRREYVQSDASGFGLAETADALRPLAPQRVIGVLSNCASLRYLTLGPLPVECPRLNPSGEDIPALAALLEASRQAGTFAVLEDSPYAPASAPGVVRAVIEDSSGRPRLTIYDLAP